MLVSEDKILQLIPQRPPMVMFHELWSCDSKKVVTRFTVRKDNIFLDENGLSASGLLENMAQTAAARIGWLMKNQPGSENNMPPVGVIGSIKNFRLHFRPAPGSILETTVDIEHEVLQATIVKGRVEVNGILAAETEMQIFITENQ